MTKLRFWDRIWSALMGVLCFVLAASLVLYAIGLMPIQQIKSILSMLTAAGWQRWVILGVSVLILVLLGLRGIGMLFRRRRDKGFVIQRTEFGDMSISMKAMENMVKKCVDSHGELTVNNTKIYLVRNGVSVDLKITLASGVNIPLTVNALQKQIKQYITSCSGVDVYEVRVKVETDVARLAPPADLSLSEDTLPLPVDQICQHKEEPQTYAAKPAEETKPLPEIIEAQEEVTVEETAQPEAPEEPEAAAESVAEAPEAEAAEPEAEVIEPEESAAEPEQSEEAQA